MFAVFERMVDPYPAGDPGMPPKGFLAFCWHYTRPFAVPLLVTAVLTALMSVIEVVFFAFVGDLVDWLAAADRATFVAAHGRARVRRGRVTSQGPPNLRPIRYRSHRPPDGRNCAVTQHGSGSGPL